MQAYNKWYSNCNLRGAMAEVLLTPEVGIAPDDLLANFLALHSLQRIVASLDTLRRSEILKHLGAIRLPDYEAPEDTIIWLDPDHPNSRESVPSLEKFQEEPIGDSVSLGSSWQPLAVGSDLYEESVTRSRWGDMPAFPGRSLHQDPNSGRIYVVGSVANRGNDLVRAYADIYTKIRLI